MPKILTPKIVENNTRRPRKVRLGPKGLQSVRVW